jgi:GT2 family glycosyltransferase
MGRMRAKSPSPAPATPSGALLSGAPGSDPAPRSKKVGIVVLNYKNYADTIECLRSLLLIEYDESDIIVVDNDSQNDSLAYVARFLESVGAMPVWIGDHPPDTAPERERGVFLVQSPGNLGYAAGNNLGIRVALGRQAGYVLILNNDTVVEPQFLQPMVDYLEAHTTAGAAGPLLLDPEGHPERHSARRRPLPGDLFFTLGVGKKLFPNNRWLRTLTYEGDYDFDQPRQVDVLSGSCMLVKSGVFSGIGLLDEGTFLFEEEYIVHERRRAAGLTAAVVPASRVVHKHSRSTSQTPNERLQAILRQSQKYYWTRYRHYPRVVASLLVLSGRVPAGLATRLRRLRG